MLKYLYGMIIASLLYYKKFRKDIKSIGFEVNPYDACVSNRIVNGKQHTVAWYVDDLKSSHVYPKVNNIFHRWLKKTYGSGDIGYVEEICGKVNEYLAMTLDYTEEGKLMIDMRKYLDAMIAGFYHKLSDKVKCPWTEKIFNVDKEEKKLGDERRATFHLFAMKAMFLTKRERADVHLDIYFLASRVR